MSEKEHAQSPAGASEPAERSSGAPIETRPEGSGGETKDRVADELSPQAEASKRSSGAPAKPVSGFVGKGGPRERDEGCPDGRPESERTLGRRVSRETRREEEKNKPASFYLYLVILFGAAFLMLLLAYFVQQRNNESTISGLQDSWNLSKDELMENNHRLEEENQSLLAEKEGLQAQLGDVQAELDGANALYEDLVDGYDKYVGYTSILQALYASEVKLEARDYDGAAAELTDIQYQYFVDTIGDYDAEMEHYHPEGMFLRPRFDALVEELTRHGALDEGWAGGQAPDGQ